VTVAVSVDGNPEDHDVRRKPATYERILKNIAGRRVNIHWTVVRLNIEQPGYMDRYLSFWNDRPEVRNIWVSVYTPQHSEESPERLTTENRSELTAYFNGIGQKYSKLTMHPGLMQAFLEPPKNPADCLFSTLSVNYTADLRTRVGPCVFGGTPSCAEMRVLHEYGHALARGCARHGTVAGQSSDSRFARCRSRRESRFLRGQRPSVGAGATSDPRPDSDRPIKALGALPE